MPGPLLTIDVGNSRIKFGLFEEKFVGSGELPLPVCDRTLPVAHADPLPWDKIESWLPASAAGTGRVIAAGVYPAGIEQLLVQWPARGWPRPQIIEHAGMLPLEVRVDFPDQVGIDRLLNAVAVNAIRPLNQPAIIVSAGTATTVDRVAADGAFEGGAILPGLELGARSLYQHTAFLPQVAVSELATDELPVLGKNTPAAIRSGLLYGQVGAIRELIRRLSAHESAPPIVFMTGGAGELLAPLVGDRVQVERNLVLRGLALIAKATPSTK
ncbi:MAG: type III pantothenate kinase [Planctomycetaceae bacterium]|nr:type III pantothenate kinase [Planctomycetaceae bacterium]